MHLIGILGLPQPLLPIFFLFLPGGLGPRCKLKLTLELALMRIHRGLGNWWMQWGPSLVAIFLVLPWGNVWHASGVCLYGDITFSGTDLVMLKLDEGGLSYLLLRGNIGCVRDCLSAVCFLIFSNRIFSIFICLHNHFQFSLQPVDNPLRIDMVLHLFGLLLDALLETIILTL